MNTNDYLTKKDEQPLEEIDLNLFPIKDWISIVFSFWWRSVLVYCFMRFLLIIYILITDNFIYKSKIIDIMIFSISILSLIVILFFCSSFLLRWFFSTKFKNYKLTIVKLK